MIEARECAGLMNSLLFLARALRYRKTRENLHGKKRRDDFRLIVFAQRERSIIPPSDGGGGDGGGGDGNGGGPMSR